MPVQPATLRRKVLQASEHLAPTAHTQNETGPVRDARAERTSSTAKHACRLKPLVSADRVLRSDGSGQSDAAVVSRVLIRFALVAGRVDGLRQLLARALSDLPRTTKQ
eukprot:1013745-Pleurochrysis_carterae.AAC.1